MLGAVAALIAVQALAQAGGLAWLDGILNRGRVLVPAGMAMAALGAILMVAAVIHGFATGAASSDQASLMVDGRVTDTAVAPGKVAVPYRGRTTEANRWVAGYFRGRVLWSAGFYEETIFSELKRSWRSGEWLRVHRYLRATLGLSGLLLLVVGGFGTMAFVSDLIAVRLLLLLAVAYVLGRTIYAFARA